MPRRPVSIDRLFQADIAKECMSGTDSQKRLIIVRLLIIFCCTR